MRSRGTAVLRVSRLRSGGGLGVRARPGGRRRVAASAVVSRVAGIASGYASGGKRNRPLPSSSRGRSARVSAQPRRRKNLLVPGRAATSCSFPRGARRISGSVRAYAVRLYGESSSVRRGGDDGANRGHGVAAGFRPGARKYVAAYCRPLTYGPIVVPLPRRSWQPFCKDESCPERRKVGKSDDGLDRR